MECRRRAGIGRRKVSCGVLLVASYATQAVSAALPAQQRELQEESAVARHICQGEDREWSDCLDQPKCKECAPIDCVFSDWGPWYDGGGCVGLKFRHRAVKVANNECGEPCVGPKIESAEHKKAECEPRITDCVFEPWTAWSSCSSITDQAVRSRGVLQQPSPKGEPCRGNTRQTKPCGSPQRQDCEFTDWLEWTQCSASCGEGRHSRIRQIRTEAANGGATCDDKLLEAKPCVDRICPSEDCKLSDWSAWSGCSVGVEGQRARRRSILQVPEGDGLACEEALMETSACPGLNVTDCIVSDWSAWSDCTKSCMGGQKYRERELTTPNSNGGRCAAAATTNLKELEVCNNHPCEEEIQDCALSQWTEWSSCSVTVGLGAKSRVRVVLQAATPLGQGCVGPVTEVTGCMLRDDSEVDCTWGDWEDWSLCTASCGGGQKNRKRFVGRSAENGGAHCAAKVSSEVTSCNDEECGEGCVDAEWAEWGDWSEECSATCGSGFQKRLRSLKIKANHCGKPAAGVQEEFKHCTVSTPCIKDRDCQLGSWEDWTHCSSSCFGVRERNRHIQVYAAGNGTACPSSALKAVEPCNPLLFQDPPEGCAGDKPQDCQLSDWTAWSVCSATCGGGQHHRQREVLRAAAAGGEACEDTLKVTAPCNSQPCEEGTCQDCTWESWSDWRNCPQCGGQQLRERRVSVLPNSCGLSCEDGSVMELAPQPRLHSNAIFCAWSDWTTPGCSGECGQSTAMRSRQLALTDDDSDYLFKDTGESQCQGTQVEAVPCVQPVDCEESCTPRNCDFGDWGEWAAASCVGLCERQRVITTMNNQCGEPCAGNLLDTKPCPTWCDESKDCILSSWSMWTGCDSQESGQRYRERRILQEPMHEGTACNAPLNETRACNLPDPEPCEFASWSDWGGCSTSCGIGVKSRTRAVAKLAKHGGDQCSGALTQMEPCSEECIEEASHSCLWDQWKEWSDCSADGQRHRSREIRRAASGLGNPCEGPLTQTDTCHSKAIDCQVSDWTDWDECDRTCGSGQTHRARQISRFPQHGGELCPEVLLQTKGCNKGPCNVRDCLLSGWADWTPCSSSCGAGMQSRHREVVRERGEGGVGCSQELGETRECEDQVACGIKDCLMTEWSNWGECSVSCGGGYRKRARELTQLPDVGGQTCSGEVLEQIDPCGLSDCNMTCIDGTWGDWSAWAPCSVSCEGGTTFRTREVATSANKCGREPEGLARQEKLCNVGTPCHETQDCVFDDWSMWSNCSAKCNGVKKRSRTVAHYGSGEGSFCQGALHETFPCHPGIGEEVPKECAPAPDVDCMLSEWEGWSTCSATCGGGQHIRSRSVVQHPKNQGKPCDRALSEMHECARNSCSGPAAVDCEFGDWEDWQPCSKCDGERKRVRKILTYAMNGGRSCTDFESEEVQQCPRTCDEPTFCAWSHWNTWSICSTNCGTGGKRYRTRKLGLAGTAENSTGDSLVGGSHENRERYQVLYEDFKELQDPKLHEMALAFFAGGFFLLAGLVVLRGFSNASRTPMAQTFRRLPSEVMFPGPRTSARITEALSHPDPDEALEPMLE
mmetsp:Transcript_23708/g.50644  ORF Transcript_23708/g.50644 Transcript_23708/m.50644 type:complete len:1561 (+) Transcript_23708:103-4785(+)